jgi:1-acyl-sn-glycerol-3-phosphate acyltransferase
MFPEGTRIRTGELGCPHRGISLLAARTRVPILPIYIENSDRLLGCFLFKKRLIIRIGESISFPEYRHLLTDKNHYLEFALFVMSKIDSIKTGLRRTRMNV